MYMEGRAPAARGSGGGVGGCSAAGGDLAAAGQVGTASGNGVAAAGVVVTFNRKLQVPAAARPWFLGQGSDGEKAAVVVYGRRPDGSVRPHNVALHRTPKSWRLIGTVSLLNELDVHGGDSVRLTREQVAAAGCGAVAAGAGLAVVVEKVAGQQQQQSQVPHHRRHVRTVEPVGKPQPLTTDPYCRAGVFASCRRSTGRSWCLCMSQHVRTAYACTPCHDGCLQTVHNWCVQGLQPQAWNAQAAERRC